MVLELRGGKSGGLRPSTHGGCCFAHMYVNMSLGEKND